MAYIFRPAYMHTVLSRVLSRGPVALGKLLGRVVARTVGQARPLGAAGPLGRAGLRGSVRGSDPVRNRAREW